MTAGAERTAKLQLARTSGIGPLTYQKLIATYGTGLEALEALPDRLKRAGRTGTKVFSADLARKEIERTEKTGARILFSDDADYPVSLAQLSPPPPILSVWGDTSHWNRPRVAIVGARNASAAALRIANDLARELGESGFTTVSGMARGVDTAAHAGSVESGTIAVIAGGVDNIYPRQNAGLRDQIVSNGLIVSESPFGYEPRAKDFPRRNRLITGLSLGVVVVEAATRSGSLISARTALEQGREVMAIPGSPLDARTRGSNGLIKNGAALVESAADIVDILTPQTGKIRDLFEPDPPQHMSEPEDDFSALTERDRQKVKNALAPVAVRIADIVAATGLPSHVCASHLVELELAGEAISLPGGMVARL